MLLLEIILGALSLLLVVQTALSFVRTRAWWVRIFDFPRAQIAVGTLLLLAIFGLTNAGSHHVQPWEWLLFSLLAAAGAVQVAQMLPYTRLWKAQVPAAADGAPPDRRLRIVISNVRVENRDVGRWLRIVRAEDPDVVVAVEPDSWWDQELRVLEPDYPHHVRQPQDNTYGMVIYSRRPLRDTKINHLVERDVPSIFTSIELPSGERVRLVVLHPRPPRPDIRQDSDLRDAELVRTGRIAQAFQTPVVIAGDLNDVAWSHTTHLFQRIARVLDPRIGRGVFATYHADHWYLRYPLDHVFLSKHFDLVELRRLGDVGSDHFPILIDLALRGDGPDRPEVAPVDRADEEAAIDAVEDARDFHRSETSDERRERKQADQ